MQDVPQTRGDRKLRATVESDPGQGMLVTPDRRLSSFSTS
jgi:hypothetical protein